MRVLILGGGGFVGRAIVQLLDTMPEIDVVIASRRPNSDGGVKTMSIDALDSAALDNALMNFDAVVNCITGSGTIIENSAINLIEAFTKSSCCQKLIHMSTMSVYGNQQGIVNEEASLIADIGWYGEAKIKAEQAIKARLKDTPGIYILRPGCVYGPDSDLWTLRIARLLKSHRLGDLGEAGDGWSNLVHVNDVAKATLLCLQQENEDGPQTYNLAAPDSPRWNTYFRDFALGVGAVPLEYITSRRIAIEGKLLAPPLKVLERICNKFRLDKSWLPDGMPPSLFHLWQQQIFLDATAAEQSLNLQWITYTAGLKESCSYIAENG